MNLIRKIVRFLPLALGLGNAVLTAIVFFFAVSDPQRSGMLPLVIYTLDFPASLIAEPVRSALGDLFTMTVTRQLEMDGSVYLVVGFLWLYGIGMVVRWVFLRLTPNHSKEVRPSVDHGGSMRS